MQIELRGFYLISKNLMIVEFDLVASAFSALHFYRFFFK